MNPVRNSREALDLAGIFPKCYPAAEQRGVISNGLNPFLRMETPNPCLRRSGVAQAGQTPCLPVGTEFDY
jgi:hypothetical protein